MVGSLRLLLLGAWAAGAAGQQCQCSPCTDYPVDDFTSECFDKCLITGDPHVEHSWNPGYADQNFSFSFQPQGIWRLMRTDTCGGVVEVQAFFCQYRRTRLSSAIAYAIKINDNDRYIVKMVGDEALSEGSPNVQNTQVQLGDPTDPRFDPVLGKIIVSDDACIRIKMNTQPLYVKQLPNAYFNNIAMKVWGCATTEEGICGNPKLSQEFIDPDSDENLFKRTNGDDDIWEGLCEFCTEQGEALTPPGCPAPANGELPGQPGCEFLRPFGSPLDKECVPTPSEDPAVIANNERIEALQADGTNCVAFVNLNTENQKRRQRTCRDWCQDRGASCVAARDDTGSSAACSLKTAEEDDHTCDTELLFDTHCVCAIPDNNAPGESVEQTCRDARDLRGFNFSYLDSADVCRENVPFLRNVTYPQVSEEPSYLQRLLLYCVQDVCASDPEDRPEVATSYGDRDPNDGKPVMCNGPLLCNVICHAQLIEDWGECMERCSASRSKLIHATAHYCHAGLCTGLLQAQESETVGLLQQRPTAQADQSLDLLQDTKSRRSSRSRRYSSSSSRRSRRSRRLFKDDGSRRSRRLFKDDGGSRRSRRLFKDDGSRRSRRLFKDDGGSRRSRRLFKDNGSRRSRRFVKDNGSRRSRRFVKDDDGSRRRRKDDDKDDSRRRRRKDDDKDDSRRRRKDDDKDDSRRRRKDDDKKGDDDVFPPDDKCVEQGSMCGKICTALRLEGQALTWCLHRCHSKFQGKLKPGFDHFCTECKEHVGGGSGQDDDRKYQKYKYKKPTTTTTAPATTTTAPDNTCPFFPTTVTTTHPDDDVPGYRRRKDDDKDGGRRRRKDDDDDGSRRRRKDDDKDKDDDGSRRRRKDDDKDGGRRRRKDDDDDSSRRRRKDDDKDKDDDGSRRQRKDQLVYKLKHLKKSAWTHFRTHR